MSSNQVVNYLITGVPGVIDMETFGAYTKEALAEAIENLNKRASVGGEYGKPRSGHTQEQMRRMMYIDESMRAVSAKNFTLTEEGARADITLIGPFGEAAQKCIDLGMLERGEVGFRLRALYRPEDWREGLIHKIIPVGVDFVRF